MDKILEILTNLSGFQVIVLIISMFLLAPTVISFFNDADNDTDDDDLVPLPLEKDGELENIVAKWNDLMKVCHKHKLNDACDKLKEVFPMFVNIHKHNVNENS